MLKKRIIVSLTFLDGILFRTKNFKPDYRYTKNFIDLWSIDELLLIDISKKKFSKNFLKIINYFTNNCFVPTTVGGGITKIEHADLYFKNGADKILLGTHNFNKNNLIEKISKKYGSQSIIQSIDCKKNLNKGYEVMCNSGNSILENDVINYGKKALKKGVGEILINSVDNDGSLLGYDLKLIKLVSKGLDCPILALGGAGNWTHILKLFSDTKISAACTQNIFHFTEESILSAKKYLKKNKINIRS